MADATGGSESTDGDIQYHKFTSDGTFTVLESGYYDILVVGAGGGGGSAGGGIGPGGGGGGGEVNYQGSVLLTAGSYAVTVGAGGAGGTGAQYPNGHDSTRGSNGGSSSFDGTYDAAGGGGGGTNANNVPKAAQSGFTGGGAGYSETGAAASGAGGDGGDGGTSSPFDGGGGGGAAPDDGDDGDTAGNPAGGTGLYVAQFEFISGYNVGGSDLWTAGWFGGGGGGGRYGSGDTSFTHDGRLYGGAGRGSEQNDADRPPYNNSGGGGGGARDQQFGLGYDAHDGADGLVAVRFDVTQGEVLISSVSTVSMLMKNPQLVAVPPGQIAEYRSPDVGSAVRAIKAHAVSGGLSRQWSLIVNLSQVFNVDNLPVNPDVVFAALGQAAASERIIPLRDLMVSVLRNETEDVDVKINEITLLTENIARVVVSEVD